MPFITQGKTNLKYILIIVILAVIVGGGILGYQYLWTPKEETRPLEVKSPEEEVREALKKQNTVGVIIGLRAPKAPVDRNELPEYKKKIQTIQDRVLSLLGPEDFKLSHKYETIPALGGQITKNGLEKIISSEDVLEVVLDKPMELF